VTMQPRNLPLADVPAVLDEPLLALGALPHAAASRATAPNATTALIVTLTDTSSAGAARAALMGPPACCTDPAGWGKSSRMSPPGLPEE